jgi:hypothetical protein
MAFFEAQKQPPASKPEAAGENQSASNS